jgi:hypothetical protein
MAEYLNTFALSAAKLSRNISDGLMRASSDFNVTLNSSLESPESGRTMIRQLLDSKQDIEKFQGMKRIITVALRFFKHVQKA